MDFNELVRLESWTDKLKVSNKPIYIYGMGNGCEKILEILYENKIGIKGIFASDDFARGQKFKNYEVLPISEMINSDFDFITLLGFGTDISEVMSRIDALEEISELYAPDTAVIGSGYFSKEIFAENIDKAKKTYSLLADDISREVFINLTAFKITGELKYLRKIFCNKDELYNLLDLNGQEIYCDLGAYNGDTIKEFAEYTNGRYRKIYALEPDKKNFQKCIRQAKNPDNIELYNAAAWYKDTELNFDLSSGRQAKVDSNGTLISARSLDSILNDRECTYIKYDVEGADIEALYGSAKTILKYSPKILTALYHRPFDYIDIPLFIHSINGDYKFYMRQSVYYPAWETNLVCKI